MTSLPTGAAARTKRRVTDTAAFVASAATPSAASTASGTERAGEVPGCGSVVHP